MSISDYFRRILGGDPSSPENSEKDPIPATSHTPKKRTLSQWAQNYESQLTDNKIKLMAEHGITQDYKRFVREAGRDPVMNLFCERYGDWLDDGGLEFLRDNGPTENYFYYARSSGHNPLDIPLDAGFEHNFIQQKDVERKIAEQSGGQKAPDQPDCPPPTETPQEKPLKQHPRKNGYSDDIDLTPVFRKLDDLIGLDPVKSELKKLAQFAIIQHKRSKLGLKTSSNALHIVMTGNPGTGKTTVARLVGEIYYAAGLLPSPKVVEATRADLVASYVGQTEGKTREKIDEADGGVLFIDEAYALAPPHTQLDFGKEVIETLLVEMENRRDNLAVIVAGYPNEMHRFLEANPGLGSRFTRTVDFPDYSAAELTRIFSKMCVDADYQASDEALIKVRQLFETALTKADRHFGNARYARTIFEKTVESQSGRVTLSSDWSKDELVTLIEDDIPPA